MIKRLVKVSVRLFPFVLAFLMISAGSVLADEISPATPPDFHVREGIVLEKPEGTPFSVDVPQSQISTIRSDPNPELMSWTTLYSENFEGVFPSAGWELYSTSQGGIYYWGSNDYRSFSPDMSVHPGGAAKDAYDPRESRYQNNMGSWMVYGPLDFSAASDARMEFEMWIDTEEFLDQLFVCASAEGNSLYCYDFSGDSGGWHFVSLSFANWAGLGSGLLGDPDVWIGFVFVSNDTTTGPGVFIDDLVVRTTSSSAEPDLYPFEYHPTPNLYHPGDSFSANTYFVNVGSDSCTSFDVTEYISTDAAITLGDISINTMSYAYTVLPDENLVMASTPTIPGPTAAGMYYIGAIYSCVGDSETGNDTVVYPNQIEITDPEVGGVIFQDNFESRDLAAWTRFNDGRTGLSVCSTEAISGDYSACFYRPDNNNRRRQLIDETPVYQTTFNVRFNFDPNRLSMLKGERFRFMQTKMLTDRPYYIVMRYTSGQYQIKLKVRTDAGKYSSTAWFQLTDQPHLIEVDWTAATGPGNNDGYSELWIDDVMVEAIGNLDNDTMYVDILKIGFTSRLEGKSISGTFYMDDVATSNGGHIGYP